MAKAYWIASYRSIKDPEAREAYAYDSPAYQAARKLLGDTVARDIRIVEGVE